MKNFRVISSLFAACLLAFVTPLQAGPTTLIFDADPAITTAGGAILGDGQAFTQTFSGTSQIKDIAFGFVVAGSASFGPISLNAYFTSWAGNDSNGILVESFTINLDNSASWTDQTNGFLTFNAEFNLGSLALDSINTYGLSFVGNADTASNNIFMAAADSVYGGGGGFLHLGPIPAAADLMSTGAVAYSLGFVATDSNGFGSPFSPTPIPEASAAAVLFAGLFVGMMLTRRQYRPRTATHGTA